MVGGASQERTAREGRLLALLQGVMREHGAGIPLFVSLGPVLVSHTSLANSARVVVRVLTQVDSRVDSKKNDKEIFIFFA